MHNIFLNMCILEGAYYSKFDVAKISILAFAFYGAEPFMGAFWFIPVMLVSVIISVSLLHVTVQLRYSKLANVLLLAAFIEFALLLYQNDTALTYFIQVSFLALPVIMVGYFCKKYWHSLCRFVTWYAGIIAASIVLLALRKTGKMIVVSANEIISVYLFYPVTFLGIYFCLALAKILDKSPARKLLRYIGKNTYHIMALHFVSFKLLDFLYTKLSDMQDLSVLSLFPTSCYFPGIVYIFAGVFIPLGVIYLTNTLRRLLQKSPIITAIKGKVIT